MTNIFHNLASPISSYEVRVHLVKLCLSAGLLFFAILIQALQINFFNTDIVIPFYLLISASAAFSLCTFFFYVFKKEELYLISSVLMWSFEIFFLITLLFIVQTGFVFIFSLVLISLFLLTFNRGENLGYVLAFCTSLALGFYFYKNYGENLSRKIPLSLFYNIGLFGSVFLSTKLSEFYRDLKHQKKSFSNFKQKIENHFFSHRFQETSDVPYVFFDLQGAVLTENEAAKELWPSFSVPLKAYIKTFLVSEESHKTYVSEQQLNGCYPLLHFVKLDNKAFVAINSSQNKEANKEPLNLVEVLNTALIEILSMSTPYVIEVKKNIPFRKAFFMGDERQIITAIVLTANYMIKFTTKSGVRKKVKISLTRNKQADQDNWILFLSVYHKSTSSNPEIKVKNTNFDLSAIKNIFEAHKFEYNLKLGERKSELSVFIPVLQKIEPLQKENRERRVI